MSLPESEVRNAKARAELTLHVARAQAGDRQALDRILRDHQGPLYLHIRTIMRDRDLAYDALQNSLLLIARQLGKLRDPRLFKAWAYRIATREGVRMSRRETRIRDFCDAELVSATAQTPVPTAAFDADALRASAEYLAALAPACQLVLRMHYLEEMTFAEIAEALEIPVGTAKSRLNYGLARLRERMRAVGHEPV